MGRADEYQFDYLDDNRRFADQVNGALFQGRQVVKPDELEPADMQLVYRGKEDGKRESYKTVVDKIRTWRGKVIHILAIENQTYVDYHMVLRNMLTECLSYQTVEREESCTCGGEGPQIWYRRVLLRDEEGREVHAGHYAGGLLRDGASMGRCRVPA